MGATVVSETYGAVLTQTARKVMPKKIVDNLSQGRFLRFVMGGYKGRKKTEVKDSSGTWPGGYKLIDGLGERIQVPLMYGSAPFDPYSGYQTVNITPVEGVTTAFYPTRQAASSIAINGFEEAQNTGDEKIISMLETKITQATTTATDGVNEIMLSGNGRNGNSLVAYTSIVNGSVGPDPLSILISKTPTTGSVGSVDPAVNDWWANQFTQSSAATYAAWFAELENLHTLAALAKGGDAEPNFNIMDSQTFLQYRAALRTYAKIESFVDADLPFQNVQFFNGVAFYDKWVPDNLTGTTPGLGGVSSTRSKGTWFMLCSEFIDIYASSANNFRVGDFRTAINQDARVALVLWYGGLVLSNRGKHALLNNIALNITS